MPSRCCSNIVYFTQCKIGWVDIGRSGIWSIIILQNNDTQERPLNDSGVFLGGFQGVPLVIFFKYKLDTPRLIMGHCAKFHAPGYLGTPSK